MASQREGNLNGMNPLPESDAHHLQAALGWLELGDHLEADKELDQITSQLWAHPDVLQVRWQVYAKAQKWDACLDIATALTKMTPDRRFGWIHRAFALHQLKRTTEAYEVLRSTTERFEPNATIPYYLARFACQLGKLKEAKDWLAMAFERTATQEDHDRLRFKARQEPDLEPLWKNIGDS